MISHYWIGESTTKIDLFHLFLFTCSAFDLCIANSGQTEPIEPKWSWMRNATFKGTQDFMGMKVDVWKYEVCE